MDNGVDKKMPHNKIAKGKKLYTTQLPLELIEELKDFAESIGVPMTILVEKYIATGLAKSKRDGTIPVMIETENE